jgi:hypothetical protein
MALIFWWIIPVVILALVGAVVVRYFIRKKRKTDMGKNFVKIAGSAIFTKLPSFHSAVKTYKIILAVAMALLIIMLSSGTILVARLASVAVVQPENYNRDIMLCLDVSGSMWDTDAEIAGTFAKLTEKFKGERIGLAIWDSSTVTIFPLNDDYDFIKKELTKVEAYFNDEKIDVDWSYMSGVNEGQGSSLIGDGLASCVGNFDNENAERSRSIILATDNYTSGNELIALPEAAQIAKDKNIRVYGLNPADYSSRTFADEEADQYKQAVLLTEGTYYAYDNSAAVQGIVEQVNRQDATRFKGAPQLIKRDQPLIIGIVFWVSMIGFCIVAWRLRI